MERNRRRKLRRPEGRCYEVAAQLVTTQDKGVLVHGQVWSILHRRMIDHAWVELPVGTFVEDDTQDSITLEEEAVLDLTLKVKHRFVPRWWYYAVTKAEPARRYSPEETRAQLLRWRTWGPWHQEGGQYGDRGSEGA